MKKAKIFFLLLFIIHSAINAENQLKTLLYSLDPHSLSQHYTFYQLYSETPEGAMAKNRIEILLKKVGIEEVHFPALSYSLDLSSFLFIIDPREEKKTKCIDATSLEWIKKIRTKVFSPQYLAKSRVENFEDIKNLDSNAIDVSFHLMQCEREEGILSQDEVDYYEALIDLLTLQIRLKLPEKPTFKQIINAVNKHLFFDIGFRFPPHSLWAEDIDEYTFLPSVVDSRRGVCLGVSILYLSIAQRLGIDLEIITPPGHIYVRGYDENQKVWNIETTARGVHMPTDIYYSMNVHSLIPREKKEIIGLAFMNRASVFLQKQDFALALKNYLKAKSFIQGDRLIDELTAYCLLLTDKKAEGNALLKQVLTQRDRENIHPGNLAKELIEGSTKAEVIAAFYRHVDETRQSILEKANAILELSKKYPNSSEVWFHLGIAYLQLTRPKEAYNAFREYHRLDCTHPSVEYYLALLALQRGEFSNAYHHLNQLQTLIGNESLSKKKALRTLIMELKSRYPLPQI